MEEPSGNSNKKKSQGLSDAVNAWLHNMAIRASGDEGIRDWMDVGVIGYRTDQAAAPIIGSTLVGPMAGQPLVSITDIGNNPARIDTTTQLINDPETGENIEIPFDNPVWVDPVAEGSTPMCHVLHFAHGILAQWIQDHPDSFPPIVVHISDGESQDGDPVPYAAAIQNLATTDGNVLLFNMSSPLPEVFARGANAEGIPVQPGARGMAFNADMVVLVKFLDMGTRAAMTLR